MKKQLLIAAIVLLSGAGLYNWGYQRGMKKSQSDIFAKISIDKETLKNHGKEIETIRNEPDTSANNRLRKNLLTN